MTQGERLRDHPAHGKARDVKAPDAETVGERHDVVRHVVKIVGSRNLPARERSRHSAEHLNIPDANARHARAFSCVPVVGQHYLESRLDKRIDEFGGPGVRRHAESLQKNDGGTGRITMTREGERNDGTAGHRENPPEQSEKRPGRRRNAGRTFVTALNLNAVRAYLPRAIGSTMLFTSTGVVIRPFSMRNFWSASRPLTSASVSTP